MVFLRSDQSITTTLDALPTATPAYIHQKQWQKYSDFQAEYASRVDLLRIEKREVPIAAGADKNMPPIPMAWTGNFKNPQPPKNFKNDCSCAFDEKRIKEYETRNSVFQADIKRPTNVAAAKMIALMTLDIAFLKSFEVEWEAPISALESGEGADDDDDESMDLDTSTWVVTDPGSVPLKDLKIPEKGKLPAHLLYACAIVGTPQVRPPAAKTFIDQVSRRLEQLGLEYGTNDSTMILTREMTDVEYDTYNSWVLEYNRRDEDNPGAATDANDSLVASPSIVAARRRIPLDRSPVKGQGAAGAGAAGAIRPGLQPLAG